MNTSLALHIISLVMWVGGILILTRVIHQFVKLNGDVKLLAAISKKIYFGWILSGCALAILTGLYQISVNGAKHYFSQGWFHGKLTLVIILIIITGILFPIVKKLSDNITPSAGKIMGLHGSTGLILILAVFATLLGR